MKVKIARQPIDYNKIGEINPEKIKSVRWDNMSGGYETKYGFYQLYGYIDYEDAMECKHIVSGWILFTPFLLYNCN